MCDLVTVEYVGPEKIARQTEMLSNIVKPLGVPKILAMIVRLLRFPCQKVYKSKGLQVKWFASQKGYKSKGPQVSRATSQKVPSQNVTVKSLQKSNVRDKCK